MPAAETKVVVTAVPTNVSTEGVVATSDTISYTAPGGEGLIVRGVMNITAGAGTTAVVVRVRKGSGTGGALVGVAMTHTLAAAASANIPYEVLDPAPIVNPLATPSGVQSTPANLYTVTVQQTGGTGAGTVNYATLGMEGAANVG